MEKKRIIEEGDLVILYERHDQTTAIYMKKDATHQNQLGSFRHNDIIGKPYGSLIRSTVGKWLYVLAPDPYLWSASLKTRTQIIFPMDSSIIICNLHLKSGSTVIESGTGSGALSTAFAQTIYPNGHLWTYEYNKVRVEEAKKEFIQNKLDSIITINYRDVYTDGLECKLEENNNNEELMKRGQLVDAVFLDLPKPYEALSSAYNCLRKGGRVCCFSPCIEQVQRNTQTMRQLGFDLIETIECISCPFEVQNHGFVNIKPELSSSPMEIESPTSSVKRTKDDDEEEEEEEENNNMNINVNKEEESIIDETQTNKDENESEEIKNKNKQSKPLFVPLETNERWYAQGTHVIRGHTSYLTFASKHKH
ncbi:hypothetical protein WA158_004651 [Blastocystis sp. Blastoise]